MLKYKNAVVTFAEVPGEVTLCINITGCPVHCEGCHSPELWEDTGYILDGRAIDTLISDNQGISCVCFMGGDNDPHDIYESARFVREHWPLKICWYSGMSLRQDLPLEYFDYVKTGSYRKDLGGLDSITTNQRFYEVKKKLAYNSNDVLYRYLDDITYKFQKLEIDEHGVYQEDYE